MDQRDAIKDLKAQLKDANKTILFYAETDNFDWIDPDVIEYRDELPEHPVAGTKAQEYLKKWGWVKKTITTH